MASYIAFGARSAPFGHSIAPSTTRACAKIAGSRSGSKIVFSILGSLRNERISTSPVTPSTKATRSRESGKTVTDVIRHGTACRIGGSTSAVRLLLGVFTWLHRFQFSTIRHEGKYLDTEEGL